MAFLASVRFIWLFAVAAVHADSSPIVSKVPVAERAVALPRESPMAVTQSGIFNPADSPVCVRCGTQMRLVGTVPRERGYGLFPFECLICQHVDKAVVRIQ